MYTVYIEFYDGSVIFSDNETIFGSCKELFGYIKDCMVSKKLIFIKSANKEEQIINPEHVTRVCLWRNDQ